MPNGSQPTTSKRFAVALSFPGERRDFVKEVADFLADAIGKDRVLYDAWYEAEFARIGLDDYLPRLYREQSDLIALFIEENYDRKRWCRLEWRAIRQLIASRSEESIMPFRFDTTEIPGLWEGDGYVWIAERGPEEIASLILQRWRAMDGDSARQPSHGDAASPKLAEISPKVAALLEGCDSPMLDALEALSTAYVAAIEQAGAEPGTSRILFDRPGKEDQPATFFVAVYARSNVVGLSDDLPSPSKLRRAVTRLSYHDLGEEFRSWGTHPPQERMYGHESSLIRFTRDDDSAMKELHRALQRRRRRHGNIFHRSNVQPGSPGRSSTGAEADRELLDEIVLQLGGETRRFLDKHDFGVSFKGARLDSIYEFDDLASQPHKEFLEPSVEDLRQQLADAATQFLLEIGVSTFVQASAPECSRIATFDEVRSDISEAEWETRRLAAEKRFERDRAKLNNLARDVVGKYDALVRAARAALAS